MESARNVKFIGHSDQGGRPDGVQVMVNKGYAYVCHAFSGGWSLVDVRDPRAPKPVGFFPCHPSSWSLHCQSHGDLLLAGGRGVQLLLGLQQREVVLRKIGRRHPERRLRQARRRLFRGPARLRHLGSGEAAADRLHGGQGPRPPPRLVGGRSLRLRPRRSSTASPTTSSWSST
ncbi:MAG: hypothetical protein WDM84_01700 [Bauldia sp.]